MVAEPPDRIVVARELTPQERGAQLEAFCRTIEREQFRDTARTLGISALWSASGVFAMAWSVSSTDQRWAPVVFWGALMSSYTGIALQLLGAWRRHLERTGEW